MLARAFTGQRIRSDESTSDLSDPGQVLSFPFSAKIGSNDMGSSLERQYSLGVQAR